MPRAAARVAAALGGLLLATSWAACTTDNPDYRPPASDSGALDASAARDAIVIDATPPDATIVTQDLQPTPSCGMGATRSCTADAASSGACAGAMLVVDRLCPRDGLCAGGYCSIPAFAEGVTAGVRCASESQCYVSPQTYDLSCAPFVVGGAVELHCASTLGTGAAGQPCKSAGECRSGICLARGFCFRACLGDSDCPNRNGTQLVCRAVDFAVEGAAAHAMGCLPP